MLGVYHWVLYHLGILRHSNSVLQVARIYCTGSLLRIQYLLLTEQLYFPYPEQLVAPFPEQLVVLLPEQLLNHLGNGLLE